MKKIIALLLKFILFIAGWIAVVALVPVPESKDPVMWRLWAELIPFAAVVVFTVVFWIIEKRQVALHLIGSPIKSLLTGLGAGVIWIVLAVAILFVLGVLEFDGKNKVSMLAFWILATFLNVAMQELLIRGYLYQMLKQRVHMIVAIVVTTALFTVLHGGVLQAGVIPIVNIVTMSLLMTAMMEYTGSLIAPILAHFIWNCVGAVVLNVVLLTDDYENLFDLTFSGSELLSGGAYKIEGSIVVTALNVLLIALFFILRLRKGGAQQSPEEATEESSEEAPKKAK